jgi:HD-like signal output (HDOD) protein/ActR/RegA family two-component response regulator
MKRIIFVDDDVPLLEGLRARLHGMADKWHMTFTDSGGQAIAEFQRQPFDLIVSDIRMPGMHGARLLRTVGERWPETVRIALSGLCEPEQTVRVATTAHQFLSKPCEFPLLENVVERCLSLQELLPSPDLRRVVGRIQRLAPQRGSHSTLKTLVSGADATHRELAEATASDTVVTARVLQMANSGFFRRGRRVSNLEQAVAHLGCGSIRTLVMSSEVFPHGTDKPASCLVDLERLQLHARQVVDSAHALTAGSALAEDTALAALLKDIGYWVLACECPRDLARAHEWALTNGVPMHEAETKVIGASHAQIGAYLLGIWGLPGPVVDAVAHHHSPEDVRHGEFDALAALSIAVAFTESDEASAFGDTVECVTRVGPDYLESVRAPFDWEEAMHRVATAARSAVPKRALMHCQQNT